MVKISIFSCGFKALFCLLVFVVKNIHYKKSKTKTTNSYDMYSNEVLRKQKKTWFKLKRTVFLADLTAYDRRFVLKCQRIILLAPNISFNSSKISSKNHVLLIILRKNDKRESKHFLFSEA